MARHHSVREYILSNSSLMYLDASYESDAVICGGNDACRRDISSRTASLTRNMLDPVSHVTDRVMVLSPFIR